MFADIRHCRISAFDDNTKTILLWPIRRSLTRWDCILLFAVYFWYCMPPLILKLIWSLYIKLFYKHEFCYTAGFGIFFFFLASFFSLHDCMYCMFWMYFWRFYLFFIFVPLALRPIRKRNNELTLLHLSDGSLLLKCRNTYHRKQEKKAIYRKDPWNMKQCDQIPKVN